MSNFSIISGWTVRAVFKRFASASEFIAYSCSDAQSCPTLQPHGLQLARLPCPSLSPGACSNSCPLSRWCHPSMSLSVIPFSCLQSWPASGSFTLVSYLLQVAKYWSFSFTISPSNEYSGLISFNIDWFDIFAVQGTLKNLPQHFSSKASNFGTQLSLYSNSHIHAWLLEKP